MSVDVITQVSDGSSRVPVNETDWQTWVAAGRTRNFLINDPLLDWLSLYGDAAGFARDSNLETYDSRTDFTQFIFRKSSEFEDAVIHHLGQLSSVYKVANGPEDIRDLQKATETWDAMVRGEPLIWQGVLRDAEFQTYGAPDLIVRSDLLAHLFPDAIQQKDVTTAGGDLGDVSWHYRIVDIKYTTLRLLTNGLLGNSGSAPAYKAQLYIYNRMLGRLQGYEPSESYLLGRGWEQRVKGEALRGRSCMERLAPIPQTASLLRMAPMRIVSLWEHLSDL